MDTWIQTLNGKVCRPFSPVIEPDVIDVDEIAIVLSRMPRFGGHTKLFYSVAEHSVNVARLVPNELRLPALLHDAHEVYSGFGDVCAPVKQMVPAIGQAEKFIDRAIAKRFNLDPALFSHPSIKKADLQMLATEKEALLGPEPLPWELSEDPIDIRLRCYPMQDAQDLFIQVYRSLVLWE